jgi:coenzyme F420-reducing hydrogenase gamma subunit
LRRFVKVDASVCGCPPEKDELLELMAGLLRGVLPVAIDYPVCNNCHIQENLCLLTERGNLCLGLITMGGCGARCPSLGVPCEGCRGPAMEVNLKEALAIYTQHGYSNDVVRARLRRFSPEWLP